MYKILQFILKGSTKTHWKNKHQQKSLFIFGFVALTLYVKFDQDCW